MTLKRLARSAPLLALLAACEAHLPPPPTPVAPPPRVAVAPRPPPPRPPPPPMPSLPMDRCSDTDDGFDAWIGSVRRDARALGISGTTVASALRDVTYDTEVIDLDRAQAPFKMTFAEFVRKRLGRKRIARGQQVMAENGELLAKVEARFGVPPEILVAIWGLETDYGANSGRIPSMQALATLAYDCKRAARFREELMSALRILDRGDLTVDELFGAWAGELGQTQFLPSVYEKFGVDFDGDGRVDMVASRADALASTAHYLAESGWRAKAPYDQGSANFGVLKEWNASEMYRKTIVLFASKLAHGA